ncbi:hypothetical protein BGZ60DRAFT_435030 [Tricladium varicosporioides]|nr:hypothetical protein BGZ60DRAFT_435030 [Hymenoscyphus varicosporioides]
MDSLSLMLHTWEETDELVFPDYESTPNTKNTSNFLIKTSTEAPLFTNSTFDALEYESDLFSDFSSDFSSDVTESDTNSSFTVSIDSEQHIFPQPKDDFYLAAAATHQVDYLTHVWELEDYAASCKAMKRDVVEKRERLENALARSWVKARYSLGTCTPQSINWEKDWDCPWLYGPFYSGSNKSFDLSARQRTAKTRPALKKRSTRELLLGATLRPVHARKTVSFA